MNNTSPLYTIYYIINKLYSENGEISCYERGINHRVRRRILERGIVNLIKEQKITSLHNK